MNPIKFLIPSVLALALASCAAHKDEYDTSNPYGSADGGAVADASSSTNQTYDTPAAYEDAGAAANSTNLPVPSPVNDTAPAHTTPRINPPATSTTGGTATTHTVVKGDTLGGIAKKYKVSIASIKAANAMTKDTVVLGKTLKIPAH